MRAGAFHSVDIDVVDPGHPRPPAPPEPGGLIAREQRDSVRRIGLGTGAPAHASSSWPARRYPRRDTRMARQTD
jgi:hypothetical protein